MRVKILSAEEQYRLVTECRASGLTDYQWCVERGIKPGTFYNWVRRLRKTDICDIPDAVSTQRVSGQEIVKVEIAPPVPRVADKTSDIIMEPVALLELMIEIALNGAVIRIPNGTAPAVLQCVRRTRGEMLC